MMLHPATLTKELPTFTEETKKDNKRRAIAQQLHNAASAGNVQEVEAIFDKHEIPIDSHRRGNTALHIALYHNKDGPLLDYLIKNGANVNNPNSKGFTPLDLSIMFCKSGKAAEKLINAGAKWRERYSDVSSNGEKLAFSGITPMELAQKHDNKEVIQLLKMWSELGEQGYCQPISTEAGAKTTSASNDIKLNKSKWQAFCPICNCSVHFPTRMSRILLDQELIEKELQGANGVSLNTKKGGRNRKKYTTRKYLDQFVSHANGRAYEKLCGITYHAVQNMRLRKEISESMGVLHAVQQCVQDLTRESEDDTNDQSENDTIHFENVFLIDLCSGRGLTTALGGALHDDDNEDGGDSGSGNKSNNFFLSIDRMLAHTVPHFLQDGVNRKYLSRDIMSETLFSELEEIVSEQLDLGRTPILVGMHLCGTLSEKAIEFFERIPSIRGIVLTPCCLPKKTEQMKGITKFVKGAADYEFMGSDKGDELYNYFKWNHFLKEMLAKSTPNVTTFTDAEMHTEKNAIVVGMRK